MSEHPPARMPKNATTGKEMKPNAVNAHTVGEIPHNQVQNITNRVPVFASREHMCDACKTMVEELHRRLQDVVVKLNSTVIKSMGTHKMPAYQEAWFRASGNAVKSMCDSEKYQHFAPHLREGCRVMLHGEKQHHVLSIMGRVLNMHAEHGTFEQGKGYVPKHCVWRRRLICEEVFGVCPEAPPPSPISDCRACAETFRDFHFVTRRDIPPGHTRPHFKNPISMRRKRLYGQLLDLCEDVHMRHSFNHADHIAETCHDLVERHAQQIIDIYLNEDNSLACPAERVCVEVAKSCTKHRFHQLKGHLEHEHDWDLRARVLGDHTAWEHGLEL